MLLKKESPGMKVTEERLKILNDFKKIKFTIRDINPGGYKFHERKRDRSTEISNAFSFTYLRMNFIAFIRWLFTVCDER